MGRGFYFQVTTDFDSYLDNPLALICVRGFFDFFDRTGYFHSSINHKGIKEHTEVVPDTKQGI